MKTQELSNKKIFIFWMPLLFLWLVVAFEFPLLTAIITYLPNEKLNLAAFGVAYSLFLLAESPLLMFNTVAIKLIKNKESYKTIKNFFIYVVSFLWLIMMLFVLTPIYHFILVTKLSFDETIALISQHSLIILLLPTFAAAGFKAFYQGILISRGKQSLIFFAIAFRVIISIVTALLLVKLTSIDSVYIATIGFSMGILTEAILTRVFANGSIHAIHMKKEMDGLSYRQVVHFYYPLVITTVAGIITTPIIIVFLNRSFNPAISLAVFPVINALIMIFKSAAMSLQNVIIYFLNMSELNETSLKKFFMGVGVIMFAILAGIIFTPLLHIYLTRINTLQIELAQAAVLPLQLLVVYPLLTLLVIWQRSVIIHQLKNKVLSWSVFAELVGLILTLAVLTNLYPGNGLINASLALVLGRICSNILLYFSLRNHFANRC